MKDPKSFPGETHRRRVNKLLKLCKERDQLREQHLIDLQLEKRIDQLAAQLVGVLIVRFP